MRNFINFFIEKFDKIVFLIFLIISFSLILNRNFFQNSKINFFSNGIISSINNQTKQINNYLNLRYENANLKRENLDLKIKLNSILKDSSINYYKGEYKIKIADIISNMISMSCILGLNISIDYQGFQQENVISDTDGIISTLPNYKLRISELLANREKPFVNIPQGYDFELVNKDYKQVLNFNFDKKKLNIIYAGAIGITNALHTIMDTALIMDENNSIFFVNKYSSCIIFQNSPQISFLDIQAVSSKKDLFKLIILFETKALKNGTSL